jgi:NADH-quinone oxidoreductase subunit N
VIDTPELQWVSIAPELATSIGAMVALLVGLGRSAWSRPATAVIAIGSLLTALAYTLVNFNEPIYSAFAGQIDSDQLANVGRIIAILSAIVAVVFAYRGRANDGRHGEFFALLLAAVCGMGLFAAAGSFVTLFVGLELFSIALYVLCALDADRATSLEAGLKYLIVGGLSGAVLLYGTSLVYGATGSLDIAQIGETVERGLLLYLGAAMVLGGLAFKVSAAPLHWWTPDVYEGAGTPVTAFMSTATKAVAFVVLVRVMVTSFGAEAGTWVPIIAALATLSIVIGNVAALGQSHLKRMLAYSSIAQAGYMLTGIVGWSQSGVPALVYALFVYAAMTLGAFAYVIVLERELGRDATFADLAGRGWMGADGSILRMLPALGMAICALSLAGIPPTAGFFSKLGLFTAAVDANYAWLALVAALGSVVSLGYYLRVIVELYMRAPDEARAAAAAANVPGLGDGPVWPARTRVPAIATVGVGLAVVTIALAFMPDRILDAGCDARNSVIASSNDCSSVAAPADAN